MASVKYQRVVLKISGEALCGDDRFGIDGDQLRRIAHEIKAVVKLGVELAVSGRRGGTSVRGATIAQDSDIEEG